jgi:flagellar motor protein MotB
VAGKGGGGAWKVAYADFVTAMMAFFLVMWICGQDQAVRKAVSYYFNDPYNTAMAGNSKTPNRSGSVVELNSVGMVPQNESVAVGRGRKGHTAGAAKSPATKMVSDWVNQNAQARKYWAEQVRLTRLWAATTREVQEKRSSVDAVTALQLSRQLRQELCPDLTAQTRGLQQDLLYEILAQVNWQEVAEDLMTH